MTGRATITRPTIVGHRGAPALAPENTIAGIDAAVRAGADAVELDVRRGRDGSLVLAHDRRRARRPSATALRDGLAELVSAHRSLVTARLVEMVRAAGGEIYVWDVGSAQQALTLSALAVDALIGDDPELLRAASILR